MSGLMKAYALILAFCVVGCGGSGSDSAVDVEVQWQIVIGGQAATCADAGAIRVRVRAASEDSGIEPVDFDFQCVLSPGTIALGPGRYAVSASLHTDEAPDPGSGGDDGGGGVSLGPIATAPGQAVEIDSEGAAVVVQFEL